MYDTVYKSYIYILFICTYMYSCILVYSKDIVEILPFFIYSIIFIGLSWPHSFYFTPQQSWKYFRKKPPLPLILHTHTHTHRRTFRVICVSVFACVLCRRKSVSLLVKVTLGISQEKGKNINLEVEISRGGTRRWVWMLSRLRHAVPPKQQQPRGQGVYIHTQRSG